MLKAWNLRWFDSGECQVIRENLDYLTKRNVRICPQRKDMYKALTQLKPEEVKVLIMGQDPYPGPKYATGIAFSVPPGEDLPPTLSIIFDEYCQDLKYPHPESGDLTPWVEQGVLLWNVIPTCTAGQPNSHNWDEYRYLTWEILDRLADNQLVVATFGSVAKSFLRPIDYENFKVVEVGHPSTRGLRTAKYPFLGSRVFSTINAKLCELGQSPIDWKLP